MVSQSSNALLRSKRNPLAAVDPGWLIDAASGENDTSQSERRLVVACQLGRRGVGRRVPGDQRSDVSQGGKQLTKTGMGCQRQARDTEQPASGGEQDAVLGMSTV
jgi:hypothetical protein